MSKRKKKKDFQIDKIFFFCMIFDEGGSLMNKSKDRKVFKRTALRTHKTNLPKLDLLRGGRRR